MILGICLAFPKMGSALNNYLTPIIADKYDRPLSGNYDNVGYPMLFSFFAMVFGFLLTIGCLMFT